MEKTRWKWPFSILSSKKYSGHTDHQIMWNPWALFLVFSRTLRLILDGAVNITLRFDCLANSYRSFSFWIKIRFNAKEANRKSTSFMESSLITAKYSELQWESSFSILFMMVFNSACVCQSKDGLNSLIFWPKKWSLSLGSRSKGSSRVNWWSSCIFLYFYSIFWGKHPLWSLKRGYIYFILILSWCSNKNLILSWIYTGRCLDLMHRNFTYSKNLIKFN